MKISNVWLALILLLVGVIFGLSYWISKGLLG